jgi:regulator of nonsense transcripts 2
MVNPPQRKAQKVTKVYPPLEAYIQHLLTVRLSSADPSSVTFVTKQLQRLPWSDPSAQCGHLVGKHLLKACRRGKHGAKDAVFDVATNMKKSRREVVVRMADLSLEELQWSMEHPSFRNQQRAIGIARVLGHLHAVALIPPPIVLEQLHSFINFGHEVTPAMREATLKLQHQMKTQQGTSFQAPPTRAKTILEDEEQDTDDEDADVDGATPTEDDIHTPVPISPIARFDPRLPCFVDPPNSVLRVKLVCCLLEACGSSLVTQANLPKLRYFFTCFQRYLFTKSVLPVEVKFAVLDSFDAFDSSIRMLFGATKDGKKKRRKRGGGSRVPIDEAVFTFLRYISWRDAHQAIIETEEADAEAEVRARNRLVVKAGGSVGNLEAMPSADDDNDSVMAEDDSIDGESDDMSDADRESSSTGSSQAESEDAGSDLDESDEETDEDEEDEIMEEDPETDVEAAEEAYARQLEQEEFERELRKLTLEAVEKGKIAARAGTGGKVADTMVHASQFVFKKPQQDKHSTSGTDAVENPFLGGQAGISLKLLKKGNKGKVEAKQLVVPDNTNLAIQALKQGEEEARERDILKARVLQYEQESSEQSSGNVYISQEKLQVIRNRPLSMDDIDRNFGTTSGSREQLPRSGRGGGGRFPGRGGRGRGGRTLKHY